MRHDNIVRIYDFFQMNNTAYIAYELLDGLDLGAWRHQRERPLKYVDIIELFRVISSAVQHVHNRGFIHRDIKPSNIFISSELGKPILIDFGAAAAIGSRSFGDETVTSDGYSPPEQYVTTSKQNERTDIYGLCATMYWAVSGSHPPPATDRQVHDDLVPLQTVVDPSFKFSERLYRVLDRGLSLNPEDRYPNVKELLNDLFPKVYLPSTGYTPAPRGDRIFLSYRREDSAHFAGRLLDFLEMRFGSGSVFLDAESIPTGIDFWDYIKTALGECAAILVVIGPRWVELLRRRQKGSQEDYVVMELSAAIEMELPIIPVLFDRVGMPKRDALPNSVRGILGLNAAIVGRGPAFRISADGICDQLAKLRSASYSKSSWTDHAKN